MKILNKIFFVLIICGCILSCQSTGSSLLTPVMGETDTILMGDMMPVALKAVEIVHHASPKNKSIHALTASLYVMYANAFVQHKADMMDISEFELQHSEKMRAKMHYLRGRDYSLSYFDSKYKDFSKNLFTMKMKFADLTNLIPIVLNFRKMNRVFCNVCWNINLPTVF